MVPRHLFFPVPCEVTGPNPEWGDCGAFACGCGCMYLPVFGDAFGGACMMLIFSPHPHNKQYWPIARAPGGAACWVLWGKPLPLVGGKSPIRTRREREREKESSSGRHMQCAV